MYADREKLRHFWVWSAMVRRCRDPKDPAYKNYGERGLTVCQSWGKFANFMSDMGPRPSRKHTLERRENDMGYGPDNCYWATREEQAKNRRMFRSNTSGVCGISPVRGRWRARIRVNGKGIHLGYFDTREAAVGARHAAMERYGFASNHGQALVLPPPEEPRREA